MRGGDWEEDYSRRAVKPSRSSFRRPCFSAALWFKSGTGPEQQRGSKHGLDDQMTVRDKSDRRNARN